MEYIGIDLHKKSFTACAMDEEGTILQSQKYDNSLESLDKLMGLYPNSSAVIEATQNWMWMVRELKERGCEVTLAHPLRLKAIAQARIKTDTIDANTLAHLLRTDLVPESYIPTSFEQDAREISRARSALVKQRTLFKNKIHAILTKENIVFGGSDLFGTRGRDFIKEASLDEVKRRVIEEFLDFLDIIGKKIEIIEAMIEKKSKGVEEIEILKSIPGVGSITAFLLFAEIGDVTRFKSGKKLASYLGLVPRISQSGEKARFGRITKLGNPQVRWALVQTAQRLIRMDTNARLFAATITRRAGRKKAIVAVARKIANLAWRLLTDRRKYQIRRPVSLNPAIIPG